MYKVFIDHKPVIFMDKKELSTDYPQIRAKEIGSPNELYSQMEGVTLDNPLQVGCSDPKASFERIFKKTKLIEAAGGVVKRKNEFLLIKRKGLWDIPKGKIDKGETPEEAGIREVMEECGIKGHEIKDQLVITYHTMKFQGKIALKRTYWYMMKYKGPRETKPQLNEGITKTKWMSESYMLAIRGRTYGSINEVLDVYKEKYVKRKAKKMTK
ncbi:MAG: NUDIX domain-containing protein [Crocinitomicaceae bacterium]|nr:NUDIX domain-containing protein [Crocinitomicaceae bacterium]